MKVCWNITSRCNANCKHCFRDKDRKDIDLKSNLTILDNIDGIVDRISFSGGEVLMYEGFLELLKAAHKKKIITSITTNGILFTEDNLREILPNTDRITLSLDYISDEDNVKYGRGDNYFQHIKNVISLIRKIDPKFNIKINTVVNKKNLEMLESIYYEIKPLNIDKWQIMRYCPYRQKSKAIHDEFEISDTEFKLVKTRLQNVVTIDYSAKDIQELENQFVIMSNGDLVVGR